MNTGKALLTTSLIKCFYLKEILKKKKKVENVNPFSITFSPSSVWSDN